MADDTGRGQGPDELNRRAAVEHPLITTDGVEHRIASPAPMALLLDTFNRSALLPTLERLGCGYFEQPEADLLSGAHALANFEIVFIGADRIADEDGIHTIRELIAINPNAKVILVCRSERMTPSLLVKAMQAGVSDVAACHDEIALSTSIDKVLRTAKDRAERVLAIGAHPDDIEIGCGGALLDHRRRGDAVTVLTLSRGAVGGDQDERILESSTTAVSIGAQLFMADLPDTCVDPGIETIRMIESIVKLVDPTIVYVHSKHDNHQDHRAVHTATMSATRGVPQLFAFQSPSATNDFAPTKFVAIDEVIVRKVEVLNMFESQKDRPYLEPEMVIASARYWARNLAPRAWYAEAFESLRSLSRTRASSSLPSKQSTGRQQPASIVSIRSRTAVES